MYGLLLAIIYMGFISLGLPDSLLGSAWPVMQPELGVSVSFAGIISMIITIGTVMSSLMSDILTKKLGTGRVMVISVMMTACALFGFSRSDSFAALCLWAVPYGLGAGAVDAALNNYVALHYTSKHMSWLHCFWGVGAIISPYIMSYSLSHGFGWNNGYFSVSVIQMVLTVILILSLPVWKRRDGEAKDKMMPMKDILRTPGVVLILISFFLYCSFEAVLMLWSASYLVSVRGIDSMTASGFASLFFIGITVGRFICGFVADRIGDKNLIRIGTGIIFFGVTLMLVPTEFNLFSLSGLVIIGFGCAPVYPSIIHLTPYNFGEDKSQAIIGVQMACAYTGSTIAPPLFGIISERLTMAIFPVFILVFALLMIIAYEKMNKTVKSGKKV